ncbi:MAG: c-type cytochrome [Acidobacteriia bacterium]|nr:c-type cytochrome [Terriglobia bacterium]MYG02415.1 c-type cytochrome [Terriglobia bacterium]MYK09948.1 c-type cytochrome [Terriglobia bacterium]
MKNLCRQALLPIAVLTVVGCGGPEPPSGPIMPVGESQAIEPPLGLPDVAVPADNPPTAQTVALGRQLYYDKTLSVDNSIACASCHDPEAGFADPNQFSEGVGGEFGGRQAPPVMNAAYFTTQFWDGRAASLEEQAGGPVENPIEMAFTHEGVVERLSEDPVYTELFKEAWGEGPIAFEMVAKSIASFERTVLVGNSPFDRYMFGDDKEAMSEGAIRGLDVFTDPEKGNCEVCHEINEEEGYALFTDNKFHNLGVGAELDGSLADIGRFEVSQVETDKGAFKTPHLRNIADSAPYMHDGHLKTLKEVVDFYVGAGNSNDFRDEEIHELDHLSAQERADLIAFMEALSGEFPEDIGPPDGETAYRDVPAESLARGCFRAEI